MEDGQPVPGSLFIYAPNQGAPIFFVILFAASAVGHIWQANRYQCFRVVGLHPVCALMFTLGFALREYGSYNYIYSRSNLIIFILSQVFIYVCPPLLELANYHVLGRIFYYVPYLAPLPPGRVMAIFGGLMALVEGLNALGVALAANPSSSRATQELGSHLTVAALAIQLVVIIIFILMAIIFHRRCAKANIHAKAVSIMLRVLYVSMALIFIRCVYRLVEHSGNTIKRLDDIESLKALSPILRYEWFFYVFDATFMAINSILWNVWNPGRFLPRKRHLHLSQDGATEVEGEDVPDDRPMIAKIGSVVTFGMLFRAKTGRQRFEELDDYPPQSRQA